MVKPDSVHHAKASTRHDMEKILKQIESQSKVLIISQEGTIILSTPYIHLPIDVQSEIVLLFDMCKNKYNHMSHIHE